MTVRWEGSPWTAVTTTARRGCPVATPLPSFPSAALVRRISMSGAPTAAPERSYSSTPTGRLTTDS